MDRRYDGTELFGPRHFLTGYLSYVMNLIGIRDVQYVAVGRARIEALTQG